MVDPANTAFWASWEYKGNMEDVHVLGAAEAIAWGRQRASRVLIRLGHTRESYFSAGDESDDGLPRWPPASAPSAGWWSAVDPVDLMGPRAGRITRKPKRVARKIDHA